MRSGPGRVAWGLALGLLAAGCSGSGEEPSRPGREIEISGVVGGQTDPSDAAVVELLIDRSDGSSGLCSASLIGPQSVLTAAHCVKDVTADDQLRIVRVTDAAHGFAPAAATVVDAVLAHPDFRPGIHDVAVLHLREPVAAFYLPLNRYPLDRIGLKGLPVRVVGYGMTASQAGDSQLRRSATKTDVAIQDAFTLSAGALGGLACFGDSGGPWLLLTPDGKESVIAVPSLVDPGCAQFNVLSRVDAELGFIRDALAAQHALPSCEADGRCGFDCPSPDPDCPCAADGFCTSACGEPAKDPDCTESCLHEGRTCPADDPSRGGLYAGGCASEGGLSLLALGAALAVLRRRRATLTTGRSG